VNTHKLQKLLANAVLVKVQGKLDAAVEAVSIATGNVPTDANAGHANAAGYPRCRGCRMSGTPVVGGAACLVPPL
jgi:hypothetical protein